MFPKPDRDTVVWLEAHVLVPLLPFLLAGVIRISSKCNLLDITDICKHVNWLDNTFSTSDLAMCIGLLSFFVGQSVSTTTLLQTGGREAEVKTVSTRFQWAGALFIAFFGILTYLEANQPSETTLHNFRFLVILFSPVVIYFAYRTQQSFKLKAVI
jgi:quinol-cytochrome oxidoreductase complex cytochrome b subunit